MAQENADNGQKGWGLGMRIMQMAISVGAVLLIVGAYLSTVRRNSDDVKIICGRVSVLESGLIE